MGSRVAYSETFVDGCSGCIGFRADFAYSCDASYVALYSGKDIKWMTELSTKSMLSKFSFYAKHHGLTKEDCLLYKPQIEEILTGQHLTS